VKTHLCIVPKKRKIVQKVPKNGENKLFTCPKSEALESKNAQKTG
jgi:hypothetical protein